MELVSDFGGFKDAIVMIFALFMHQYSHFMYNISISHEFSFGTSPSRERLTKLNQINNELKSGRNLILTEDNLSIMSNFV